MKSSVCGVRLPLIHEIGRRQVVRRADRIVDEALDPERLRAKREKSEDG
jgi:hypothetical protein